MTKTKKKEEVLSTSHQMKLAVVIITWLYCDKFGSFESKERKKKERNMRIKLVKRSWPGSRENVWNKKNETKKLDDS